jgi:3-dehydroquinate dehydratase type I
MSAKFGDIRDRICLSLGNCSFGDCLSWMDKVSLVELRFDLLDFPVADKVRLLTHPVRKVVTCRKAGMNPGDRLLLYEKAISNNACFIDLDFLTDRELAELLAPALLIGQTEIIASLHDFKGIPSPDKVDDMLEWAEEIGAGMIKIAAMISRSADLINLIHDIPVLNDKLILTAMGEKGVISRLIGPLSGAPFTYASISNRDETAKGQLSWDELTAMFGFLGILKEQKTEKK